MIRNAVTAPLLRAEEDGYDEKDRDCTSSGQLGSRDSHKIMSLLFRHT